MASAEPPAPYRTVTPRVFVDGIERAVAFLRTVFDAAADIQSGQPTNVGIGDSVVMVSSTAEREAFPRSSMSTSRTLTWPTSEQWPPEPRGIEAPLDTPYGDRRAMFSDAFDNIYQVAHQLHVDGQPEE